MPRSFLVKTHASHRIPNYGQLETRRGVSSSCAACDGLGGPSPLPDKAAPSTLGVAPGAQDSAPIVTRGPLPRPHDEDSRGASCPGPPAPSAPLKDSLNHLNLPPLLALPTRWAPIRGPDGAGAAALRLGGFQCLHCHRAPSPGPRPPPGPRAFTCRLCEKAHASLGALKLHLRTHTLPCVCALCGKAFSRPWLLQGHVRTHTGEKPYACPHCSRAFADRSNLRAHLQTHSDTKKYPCAGCAKTFSRVSLLARHEESGCRPRP
ncbi:zinc finger protein SNAI3 [Dasypus novemcinctus]|uniref:zinc finger protein SNAI3 n=1 Tax=Dasypus novemcinctus TaxID=9361 RepID=UPI00265E761B|nr:zinc finger protein SNAI3 [Dasypus novemcinctus]